MIDMTRTRGGPGAPVSVRICRQWQASADRLDWRVLCINLDSLEYISPTICANVSPNHHVAEQTPLHVHIVGVFMQASTDLKWMPLSRSPRRSLRPSIFDNKRRH